MTNEEKSEGQATDTGSTETNQPQHPLSLDAAAYAASQTKPTETPAKEGEAATAADKAAAKLDEEGEGVEGAEDIGSDADEDVRSLSRRKPEDLEKLLNGEDSAEEGEEDEPEDKKAKAEGEGEGDDEDGKPDGVSIPKPRFDKVNKKAKDSEDAATRLQEQLEKSNLELSKEREEKAYYKGLLEGSKQGREKPGGDEPEQKDPVKEFQTDMAQLEADREEAIAKVAKDFDDGKLTMAELRKQENTINRNADKIGANLQTQFQKLQSEASKKPTTEVDQEQVSQRINADPRLQAATERLIVDNPWLEHITDQGRATLTALATQRMESEGIANEPTPEATWHLRQNIALIGKELGFNRISAPAAPAAGKNGKQPSTTSLPPITTEQRREKLELAGKHPPAPGVGGTSAPTDTLEGLDYETVKVRDLAKMLPTAKMEKMLLEG